LNVIFGMTDLTLDTELSEEQRGYLSRARASAETLLTLVDDVIELSRIQIGSFELHPREFSLQDRVREVIDLASLEAGSKGLRFTHQIAADAPTTLVGDPNRLRQVLVNLLDNAIKLTDQGQITLTVSSLENRNAQCRLDFSVAGAGAGVPLEKQRAVFGPFETVGPTQEGAKVGDRGPGLGLIISSQIAHLMGGRVWLDSEAAQGSIFHFEVPFALAPDDAVAKDQSASEPPKEPASRRPDEVQTAGDGIGVLGSLSGGLAAIFDVSEAGTAMLAKLEAMGFRQASTLSETSLPPLARDPQFSCAAVNLAAPKAWETLRLVRRALPHTPLTLYSLGNAAQRGFRFTRMDVAITPMPDGELNDRLVRMAPSATRVIMMSGDMDVITDLRSQLSSSKIRSMAVLNRRQMMELLPMTHPDAVVLHVSPSCPDVFPLIATLRSQDSRNMALNDLPILLLLDAAAHQREGAFAAGGIRMLEGRSNFHRDELPRLLSSVLGQQIGAALEQVSWQRTA
jgi:hypothetical protein